MLIIFHLLLVLRPGHSTDALTLETQTVVVGEAVNLNCTRQSNDYEASLFWIRIVSGKPPEVLGGAFSFDSQYVERPASITARKDTGSFLLQINKVEQSDAGVYYCLKVNLLNMIFVAGVFLRVKGPEPDVTDIYQEPPSGPVHPGDSVTLQCSVVSDSENKSCPAVHSVYWFRPGSGESYPSIIHAPGNGGGGCERSPEARSPQTCVQRFSKNVSSPEAGTYHCAVATCGHILFGKGIKLEGKAPQAAGVVQLVLSAALAISLIVIVFLIYHLKKKTCDRCTAGGEQRSQQINEESVSYAAISFTRRKATTARRQQKETVYTGVNYTSTN